MGRDKGEDITLERMLESLGLPDDFYETVLAREPAPAPQTLRRIKEQTLARLPQARPRRRVAVFKRISPVLAAAAILFFAIVLTVARAGPSRVWAGMQRVLTLVPGFGLVENGDQEQWTLFARQKVRAEGGGGFVEVSGLLGNSRYTGLQLYCEGLAGYVPALDQKEKGRSEAEWQREHDLLGDSFLRLYLLDDAGRRYELSREAPRSVAGSSTASQAWLQFPPLDRTVRRVTLVVPLDGGEPLKVEVPLAMLEDDRGWGESGASATEHDLSVSAAAFDYADTWIALAVTLNGREGKVTELGRYFPDLPANLPLTLTGQSGKQYSRLLRGWGGGPQNYFELFFEGLADDEAMVRLEVPLLQIRETAATKVKVAVPNHGFLDLDRTVALGRFELRLTRAEKISYDGQEYLRLHVDLGPPGTETLESFTLGGNLSWGCTFNEETGRMEYLEVPLEGSPSRVTLTLADPVYSVAGPWILDLPVQR